MKRHTAAKHPEVVAGVGGFVSGDGDVGVVACIDVVAGIGIVAAVPGLGVAGVLTI